MFVFWQLCHGILEGAFHKTYISDAANLLSLSSCVGFASALLGMALYYWVFTPELNALVAKENYS